MFFKSSVAFSSQIIGGQLATVIGGRSVVGLAIFVGSLVTLLSPIAARGHINAFIALRAALGVTQGAVFPALQSMWSVWAPPFERSVLTGITFAGAQVGNGK